MNLDDFDINKIQKELVSLDELEKKVLIAKERRTLLKRILELLEIKHEAERKKTRGGGHFTREMQRILEVCQKAPEFALYKAIKNTSAHNWITIYVSQYDGITFPIMLKQDIQRAISPDFKESLELESRSILKN